MFKVKAEHPDIRNEIIRSPTSSGPPSSTYRPKSLTLALIGDETKADAMQKLLESFGILELVRTGMVALERGAYTIGDETKEKTEFNLGRTSCSGAVRPARSRHLRRPSVSRAICARLLAPRRIAWRAQNVGRLGHADRVLSGQDFLKPARWRT